MNRILRTFAVAAVSLFVGVAMAADKHEHEHQPGPDDHSVEAKVGKKYESDAPLRSYMGKIRADVQSALDQVHQGRMKDKDYQILAQKTDQSVQSIFKECKLTAEADVVVNLQRFIEAFDPLRQDAFDNRPGANRFDENLLVLVE